MSESFAVRFRRRARRLGLWAGAVELEVLSERLVDKLAGDDAEAVRSALALLEGVHRIPWTTTPIPIKLQAGLEHLGAFAPGAWSVLIRGGSAQPLTRLVVVHEAGHFIDRCAFPTPEPGQYGSKVWPEMRRWYRAVAASGLVGHWEELIRTTPSAKTDSGRTVEAEGNYLLKKGELWARSYTQFIASVTGDAELQKLVEMLACPNKATYPWQWEADDFRSIEKEIYRVFKGEGWLR